MFLPGSIAFSSNHPSSECVSYAEEELTRCLKLAGLSVFAGGKMPEKTLIIHLEDSVPGLPGGAFRRTVTENGIRLESSEGCGIIYGSYDLLEDLGFRFLAPDCEVVPTGPLMLDSGTMEEKPAFKARELFWRCAMEGSFAVKLRLNSARSSITPRQGGKLMFYNFSHSFDTLVPADRWFDSHPEYFSMRNGTRVREKTQLCLSNPGPWTRRKEARPDPSFDLSMPLRMISPGIIRM